MDDATLRRAARDLADRLRSPARVVALEAAGRRLSLLIEWPPPERRSRLVVDVDPAHATLHLAPAGREPLAASAGGFGGGLPGLFLTAVEEAGEPRLLRLRFLPPPRAGSAQARTLLCEWTGRSGNLRLLDPHDIVLESALPGGPRAGETWRPPRRRIEAPAMGATQAQPPTGRATAGDRPDGANGSADSAGFHPAMARAHAAALSHAETEERRTRWLRAVRSETRRLLRLRDHLLREQVGPGFGPRLRRSGEAILSHIHELKKGDAQLHCPDWAEDSQILEVELDPARTPAQNAEVYFRRARRWERGEPHRQRRLREIDKATARLSVLEAKIRDSEDPPGEAAFGRRLDEALGLLRRQSVGAAQVALPPRGRAGTAVPQDASTARDRGERAERQGFRPRSYQTKDGWTVLVGRSNRENDYLTHHLAHPEDYWFHAHGAPGSHVILRREGRKDNPSAKTIEEAAAIAAFFSKARHSSKAPVVYTLKKYVRRPRGAKAGLAVCLREKSIMVMPKDPAEGREPEWMEE